MYIKYFLLLTPPSLSGDPLWELKEKEGRKKSMKVTYHVSASFWNQVLCYSAELKYWRWVFKENLCTSTYQNTYSLTNHTLTDTAAQTLFIVNLSVLCTATSRLNTPGKLSHWKKVLLAQQIFISCLIGLFSLFWIPLSLFPICINTFEKLQTSNVTSTRYFNYANYCVHTQ